jgi:formimidoylglutamate deiminase
VLADIKKLNFTLHMPSQNNPAICVKYFHFTAALMSGEWMIPAYIGIDDHGVIQYCSSASPEVDGLPVEEVDGIALPGFQNGHSHAFQYAMAGMAEQHTAGTNDDFWSWREAMYQCALSLDPDQIQTIATALYIEMLKKGYTHVAEFHYLHHDKNGSPYGNPSETGVSLLAAAAIAGIKITLIPVYYQKGGFGIEAQPRQRRFIFKSTEEYFRLLDETASLVKNISTARMGFGVHSLRAVDADDVVSIFNEGPQDLPFHLHAAEQLKEVNDCLQHLGQRPVAWLLDHLPLSDRFNLVHCTHMNDAEVKGLAKSKANVVLCPGTEGNLGDGIFRLSEYAVHNGKWCIGTDSHISLNPLEDLRWLDYGQRLISHKRNTFNDGGSYMVGEAFRSGSKAMGIGKSDFFAVGQPLDAVVYNGNASLFSDLNPSYLLSRILYTADSGMVLGTIINGRWIVNDGYHHEEEAVRISFRETIQSLLRE